MAIEVRSAAAPAARATSLANARSGRHGERGQGAVEYGFILILIAITLLIVVEVLGAHTQSAYSNIATSVGTAGG